MNDDQIGLLVSIDNKVDEVKDKLHSIELIQTRMETDLKYHIKRTDLLEQKVLDIDEKMKPVETTKNVIWVLAKIIAFLAGAVVAVFSFFKDIFNKN
jgi:hypothetical protein